MPFRIKAASPAPSEGPLGSTLNQSQALHLSHKPYAKSSVPPGALGGSSGVKVAPPQEEEVQEQSCRPDSLRRVTSGALLTRPSLASSLDRNTSSLIITLTAGPLLPRTLQDTKKEVSPVHHYQFCTPCVWVFPLKTFFLLGSTGSGYGGQGLLRGCKRL